MDGGRIQKGCQGHWLCSIWFKSMRWYVQYSCKLMVTISWNQIKKAYIIQHAQSHASYDILLLLFVNCDYYSKWFVILLVSSSKMQVRQFFVSVLPWNHRAWRPDDGQIKGNQTFLLNSCGLISERIGLLIAALIEQKLGQWRPKICIVWRGQSVWNCLVCSLNGQFSGMFGGT